MTPVDLSILNYPVETPEAFRLLNSNHKNNQAKALAAFSSSVQNYSELLKRHSYKVMWRTKAIVAYSQWIREPDCINIPFDDLSDESWWGPAGLPYDSIVNDYNLNELIEALGLLYDSKPLP